MAKTPDLSEGLTRRAPVAATIVGGVNGAWSGGVLGSIIAGGLLLGNVVPRTLGEFAMIAGATAGAGAIAGGTIGNVAGRAVRRVGRDIGL